MRGDRACALAAIGLASVYAWLGGAIQESLLSDAVGAQGVPRALAAALALLGALLLLRSFRSRASAPTAPEPWRAHGRALAMLGIAAGYLLLLPLLGYAAAISALVAAAASLGGARPSAGLAAVSVAAGAVLWLSFAKAFGVALPVGALWRHVL
ncbi:MAG: tripartite tricarboxylate transporter TctB family protein [Alphaproteobacteria bacterium]|nr:tripartite tricarboxylate transporter TctB family protein [Alphaproteobacteria bacterium]